MRINTIQQKLFISIILPVMLIATAIIVYNIRETGRWTLARVEKQMTGLSRLFAGDFDNSLREVAQSARTTASFMENVPDLSPSRIYQQLRANIRENPLVYGAGMAFEPYQYWPEFRLISPYVYRGNDGLKEIDIGAGAYDYTEAVWEWYNKPKQFGISLWSEPYLNEGTGDILNEAPADILMSTYSVPFYRDGNFYGVTTIDIPLAPLRNKIFSNLPEGVDLLIVNQSGQFIYHPDHQRILKGNIADGVGLDIDEGDLKKLTKRIHAGQSGHYRVYSNKLEDEVWFYYSRIKSSNWMLAISFPEKQALAFVGRQSNRNVWALSFLLILFIIGIYLISRRIVQPLSKLNTAALAISRGRFDTRVNIKSKDELGRLADSFNQMADSLKKAREDLRRHSEGLELRVKKRTEELEDKNRLLALEIRERENAEIEMKKAMNVAEAATLAKGNFLANMSHEIRTPMNAIIGLAYLTLQTELAPKQQNYLKKLQASARALLGIIDDILDFSKIEAGRLSMEAVAFDLDNVLEDLINLVGIKAYEKKLEFLYDIDPKIPRQLIGDPLRLGQVLINLSNNAVKFTEKGEVVVKASLAEKAQNHVKLQFSVRDTGIGMSKQQRAGLFKAFTQADTSTTRKYGGTGLGLVISRKLVELMEGQMWVDSRYGIGTTFHFHITCKLQSKREKTPSNIKPLPTGLRALVVDDNDIARHILQQMLTELTFKVTTAASGEKALEIVTSTESTHPFDLVLMDWKMPGMNGIETARKLRASDPYSSIPVIVMVTAFGREEMKANARDIQLDDFLEKPVTPSILYRSIGKIFQNGSVQRQKPDGDIHVVKALDKLKGARLLLVEDNEINQEVARELLTGAGFVVDIVSDGKQAVKGVSGKSYDAVLMDVQMPVMDGYAATKEIRKKKRFRDLPIIAMTANAMVGDREKALEAGMNDHIAKPIEPDQLFQTLYEHIHREAALPARKNNVSKVDMAVLAPVLRQLKKLLADGDLEAGEIAQSLVPHMDGNHSESAAEIVKNISNYNFEKALEKLNSLEASLR